MQTAVSKNMMESLKVLAITSYALGRCRAATNRFLVNNDCGSANGSSWQVPEFRVAYTITTDKFDALYKKLKPKGVTTTALLAKAAGIALAKHPLMYACKYLSQPVYPRARPRRPMSQGLPCIYSSRNEIWAAFSDHDAITFWLQRVPRGAMASLMQSTSTFPSRSPCLMGA